MPSIKILLVSDLHAGSCENPENPSSWLDQERDSTNAKANPVVGLIETLNRAAIHPDFLVCTGDIGNIGNPTGIAYGWEQIAKIRKELNIQNIITTCGNHDIQRPNGQTVVDPWAHVRNLSPSYPFDDIHSNIKYFTNGFHVANYQPFRFIIVNSCAFHDNPAELERGKIAKATIDAIEAALQVDKGRYCCNIIAVHHHPHRYAEIDYDKDYDSIVGGSEFLNMLETSTQNCLVLHGHKHLPRVSLGGGLLARTVLFSIGSLSAILYQKLATISSNQFYILELDSDSIASSGMVGDFTAWDFQYTKGWVPAVSRTMKTHLPYKGSFGSKIDHVSCANTINGMIDGKRIVKWASIIRAIPHLRYASPYDIEYLQAMLTDRHNCGIDIDQNGRPIQAAPGVTP